MDDTTKINNLQFLEAIFNGFDPERETPVVCAFPEAPEDRESSGRGWPAYHPLDNSIRRRIDSKADENNTYFCISTVDPTNKPLTRRAEALKGTWVFPLDDIGHGEGAKYQPSTVPLEPSAVIETSKHNYQYLYLTDEPVRDTPKAQALLKKMCQDHGDSGASIAAKYIRLPVGWNSKAARYENNRPFPTALTEWHPERRYSVEQLMQAFSVTEMDLQPMRARSAKQALKRLMGTQDTDELDPVYAWLHEEGHVVADVDGRGFATVTCPWAEEHSTGNDTAGYSPRGSGGDYADERQFVCLHDHCSTRNVSEYLQWVVDKGGPDLSCTSLTRFTERYVYIQAGELVYDKERPGVAALPLRSFHQAQLNNFYYLPRDQGKPLKMLVSKEWQASSGRTTVDNLGFHPAEGRIYADRVDGSTRLNTYAPFNHWRETEDFSKGVGKILKHLKYLFGDDYEGALDWMAATIHAPERRLQYALLHVSLKHGTGRGWLKQLLSKMSKYTTIAKAKELAGAAYNEWIFQSTLITVDEVFMKGEARYTAIEEVRELITEPRIQVNIKFGFKGSTDVFANFFLMSNHVDAMAIPEGDRRIWCVLMERPPMPRQYYRELFAVLDNDTAINQFYWLLKRRLDAGNVTFDEPPHNDTKALMQNAGRSELATFVHHYIEELRNLGVGVVWRGHLTALLRGAGVDITFDDNSIEGKQVLGALREYGCVLVHKAARPSKDFHATFPGQKPVQRLLAISDISAWSQAGQLEAKAEAERAAHLEDMIPDPGAGARLKLV